MVDKDAVRRGYDELAETYAADRTENGRDADVLAQFFAPLPTPIRVLDAGCGRGTPGLHRVRTSGLIGVDLSREQLELADGNAPHASVVQGDVTRLPLRDGGFDAVVAYHSLIHVPREDHQTVLDEFARVLRPGGRLLLSEGRAEWSGTNPDWLDRGVEMQWDIAGAAATRDQLRTAGFTITAEREATDTLAQDSERWLFFSARLDT